MIISLFRRWGIILRLYSLSASVVPILISGVYSYKCGWFNWFDFLMILFAGIFLHLGANLLNTYYDYINGVDKEDSDDIAIVKGFISKENAFKLSILLLLIASIMGLFIVFKYSLYSFLYIAALGFFLAIFYTAGPFSFKYRALGEIVIFLCFGPLIVSGSVMIMAKKFISESIILSIPSSFLIVNILLANNIRDDKSDTERGIKTIVDIIGVEKAKKLYILLLIISYIVSFFIVDFSLSLIVLLFSSFPAINLFKLLKENDYKNLVRKTAEFVGIFGVLFSVSLFLL
jgi:1,4-dihydroxy-2-naphthoate octaprenyltransferase